MSKRTNKSTSPVAADNATDANDTVVVTVADTSDAAIAELLDAADPVTTEAAVEEEIDSEILALLADENTPLSVEAVSDPEPVSETAVDQSVEEIEVEAPTEDEILAEIEEEPAPATVAASPADASTKPERKKREPKVTIAAREFGSVAAIDPATLKSNMDGSTAIKVNEKVANMIQAIETGKKLSRYTAVAIQKLVLEGKVSGKTLVDAYTAEGLKLGTARAQSQQMTALFKIAGLATPSNDNPRELILADKGLADELTKLAA